MKKYLLLIIPFFITACMTASTPMPTALSTGITTPVAQPLPNTTPTEIPTPSTEARRAALALGGRVFSAIFSPDGRTVAAAYADGNHLALVSWDVSSALGTGTGNHLLASTSYPAKETRLSFNSDGSRLLVSVGKAVFLMDVARWDILNNKGHTYLADSHSAAFYPGGKSLLVDRGGALFDKIKADDFTMPPEYVFQGPYLTVNTLYVGPEWDDARRTGLSEAHLLVFSPSGKKFAAGGGRFIGLWDVANNTREKFYLGINFVQSISFSPDEKTLALIADNNQLYIWNLNGSDPPKRLIYGGVGSSVKYSPDGKLLAVGMADGSIQLWDAASLRAMHKIDAHSGLVTGIDFSPDGSLLLSSSYDGTVALWDVQAVRTLGISQAAGTPVPAAPTPNLTAGEALTLAYIRMQDADHGWAIDSLGRLLKTSDGAAGWQDVSPARIPFTPAGFFALDDTNVWVTAEVPACYQKDCPFGVITDGTVWHTDNGGQTWQASQPFSLSDSGVDVRSVPYYRSLAMQFIDAQNGWLLVSVDHRMQRDYYRLFRTTDGGATWSRMIDQANGPPLAQAFGFAFLDSRLGWLVGEGPEEEYDGDFVYKTQDGGATWQSIWSGIFRTRPNFRCDGYMRIRYVHPDGLYLGAKNRVYDDDECKNSWESRHFLGSTPVLNRWEKQTDRWKTSGDPFFLDTQVGWTLEVPGPGQTNQIQQTLDGGASWQIIKLVAWQSAQFDFISEQVGWAVVDDGTNAALVHSVDGGKTWAPIKPVAAP